MSDDLLRQWQSWAGLFAPSGFAAYEAAARHGAAGFAPFGEAAERFKAAAQTYLDTADGGSTQGAAQAAQQFGEFLREQFAEARLPWAAGFGASRPAGAQPPYSSEAPALGATREHQQRWQRMAEAWRRAEDSQRRLQRMWSDTLRESAAAFAVRLQQRPAAAASAETPRELYDAWVDCAEDGYARLAHSAAFCDAQAELVNANSLWRREAQAGIEQWAKLLDLPTRSELNTLERRLKSIEQQLQAAGLTTPRKIEP